MKLTDICQPLDVHKADLTESRFYDVNLTKAQFNDVCLKDSTFTNINLSGARFVDAKLVGSTIDDANLTKTQFNDVCLKDSVFTNINLTGARFADVNLADATIDDANLSGTVIDGTLIADLIDAYRNRIQAVLYAKDLPRLQAFYQGVFQLSVEHSEPDHVALGSAVSQLVIVQVSSAIASTIRIADPPARRTQTPVKLVFEVKDLSAARDAALKLGGELDPATREWTFLGRRVCDGHDPEGNVLQFRQRATSRGVP